MGKRLGVTEYVLKGEREREELRVRTVCCWQTEMTVAWGGAVTQTH